LLTVHRGAFGAARNDDWSYARVVFNFARDGHFRVDGWIQTMLVGHTLLAWPLIEIAGDSIRALQIFGLASAAIGVMLCYVVLRRIVSPAFSAIACLALVLGPVFGSLSVSYMTDTTAFAAQMATLYCGLRALETRGPDRSPWLAAAAVVGVLAFSIREYAIVAFPAIAIVALARAWTDRTARRRVLTICYVFAAVAVALLLWRRSLPNTLSPALDLRPGLGDLRQLARFWVTLGLFVSPIAVAISPVRAWSAAWRSSRAGATAALIVGFVCVALSKAGFIGNYVTERGSYPNTTAVSVAPTIIPVPLFDVARVVGAYALFIALLVLAAALADGITRRRGDPVGVLRAALSRHDAVSVLVAFSALLTFAYVVVIIATTGTFFDRYLIPLVPIDVALLAIAARRGALFWTAPLRVAAVALLCYGAFGFVFVDAAATVDGAKWRAAERLVSEGYRAPTIDAGYEWFGLHQSDDVVPDWQHRRGELATRLFSARPVCARVVLSGNEQGARLAERRNPPIFRSTSRTLLGREVIAVAVQVDPCRTGEGQG
jgi:hypothetical protein